MFTLKLLKNGLVCLLLTSSLAVAFEKKTWEEFTAQRGIPHADEKGVLDLRWMRLTDINFNDLNAEERKKVTRLDLRYNCLRSLPPEIETFEELQDLDVSCNELESLPDQVGRLKKLLYLSVASNKLKKLTPAIGQLKLLRDLNLFGNQLRTLPSELGNLCNLKILNMLGNPIEWLPPALSKIVHAFQFFDPREIRELQEKHTNETEELAEQSTT